MRAGRADRSGDIVQRLVPRRFAPAVGNSVIADARPQDAVGTVDNLARRAPANTEKALAFGIRWVAMDTDHLPVGDFDLHAADRGQAIHRTHRAVGLSHLDVQLSAFRI